MRPSQSLIRADGRPFRCPGASHERAIRSKPDEIVCPAPSAKQIVHSGRGTLAAYSADGKTTFSMRLPRHAPLPERPLQQVEGGA
jgi:hypothetical protein